MHFKSIDGLRGIAVLFVLLSHASNSNLFFHHLINFKDTGKVGVYLFFVLSAYLLDSQIALALMKNKSNQKYWLNYFLRRFLRIYPLFFVALIFNGLLTAIGFPTVIDQLIEIPAHLFLLMGQGVFWSIPVEFKYYFISPFLLWLCHKYLKWEPFKLLVSFLVVILLSVFIEIIFNLPQISTLKFFPIFMVGTFISIFELIKNRECLNRVDPRVMNISGIICFIIVLLSVPFYSEKILGINVNFQAPIYYFPYALLWSIILLSAKYGHGLIKTFLEFKLLRYIGSISFSIYLFHLPILQFAHELNEMPEELRIYIFFALTIVVSSLSYLLIERPLSRFRII